MTTKKNLTPHNTAYSQWLGMYEFEMLAFSSKFVSIDTDVLLKPPHGHMRSRL
jgi:hypothetical protein